METRAGSAGRLGWVRDEDVDRVLWMRAACGWPGDDVPPTDPPVEPDIELAAALGPGSDWAAELRAAATGTRSRRRPAADDVTVRVLQHPRFLAWLRERAATFPADELRRAFPPVQRVQAAAGLPPTQLFDVTVVELPVAGPFVEVLDPRTVLASPTAVLGGDVLAALARCARQQV